MVFSIEQKKDKEPSLKFNKLDGKLIDLVLESDKKEIENGKLMNDAINHGLNSFVPDLFFEKLVSNYQLTKNIYGESIIRQISGYDGSYVERNLELPEFKILLKEKIAENIEKLKEEKLLDDSYNMTEKGEELAALILYTEELDNIAPKGMGKKIHRKSFIYGDKNEVRNYKKHDRYRDISIKKSMKTAIRRNHTRLHKADLKVFARQSKGQISLIYGLDASGSMKGRKIESCKKAGVALAYKAISEKDKVGLIVFGSEIETEIAPTDDFSILLKAITKVRAKKQTDLKKTIEKATELFPDSGTKHLILITDALPTVGEQPEEDTLQAVSDANSNGITISLIGIGLNEKGELLASQITEIGNGRFYIVKNLEDIDKIVLEDYYSV